ncbi:MAG: L,D-transpeptidase family protein, partial [Bacteroidetes bacterium]|nr:L,D-transpeptidase family protein [Bacteroidota bacterium]
MKNVHFLLLFIAVTIISCKNSSEPKPKPVILVAKPELVNEKVTELITEKLSTADSALFVIAGDTLFATELVIDFYRKNKFNSSWTNKGVLLKYGYTLLNIINHASEYGLIPTDYHSGKIDSLIRTEKDPVTKRFDVIKISEADLLLTDAFFTLAVHINKGRLNRDSLTREWIIPFALQPGLNLPATLDSAIKNNCIRAVIDSLEPKNISYQNLKSALKKFQLEFKNSNWDSLKTKESDPPSFNGRLKQRLIASHDYFEEMDGSDSIKLLKGIKNFQCKHYLTEDGRIGKITFKALQRTKQDYIRQIEMNMERWRWYNLPKEKQFVWVNIPKYEMQVIEEDTLVIKSRIIVGANKTPTPLLKSTIRYFLIYPYWTVPLKIAVKEILPILKRDTSYLRRKNFEVLDRNNIVVDTPINWKKYNKNYFPWKLRQRIGDENSLGILKFNFYNKYGVYMHDTDNRRLFNREMRAMSHGCVRLEKFIDFAKFLIRDDSLNYPSDSLMLDLLQEQQKYVYIKYPIPIYINYFTNEVNENLE